MLRELGLSRSNYYDWQKREVSAQQTKKNFVCALIQKIYDQNNGIYGAPMIAWEIRKQNISITVKTVGNYMREMGLWACYVPPWTTTTRDPEFDTKLENILNEQFNPDRPNAAWCIDTTYIPTDDGFMYLTSIMDLYSRSIIAWDLADTLSTEVVIPIIKKAKRERQTSHPLIIHSDRGSQFTSQSFRKVTGSMTNSYSKKGYPWDNACIEAFHAVIKCEWLNRFHIKGKVEAERLCFEYIDAYYNTVRIHSHCHYMSPREYEKLYYEHNKRRHAA